VTIPKSHAFREIFPVSNYRSTHRNQGDIFLGCESAKLGLRHGDSHF
jgi:hypothetical protein